MQLNQCDVLGRQTGNKDSTLSWTGNPWTTKPTPLSSEVQEEKQAKNLSSQRPFLKQLNVRGWGFFKLPVTPIQTDSFHYQSLSVAIKSIYSESFDDQATENNVSSRKSCWPLKSVVWPVKKRKIPAELLHQETETSEACGNWAHKNQNYTGFLGRNLMK